MGRARVRLVAFLLTGATAAGAVAQEPSAEWSYFGGDHAATRYSALDLIDRNNVHDLEIVWRRPAADPALLAAFPDLQPNAYLRSTPIMVDGVLYAPDALGFVEAFDPATGETIW